MGLFFRPRRPLARLAAGEATTGVAYHAGAPAAAGRPHGHLPQWAATAPDYVPPPAAAPARADVTRDSGADELGGASTKRPRA